MNRFASKVIAKTIYDTDKKMDSEISRGAVEFFSIEDGLTRRLAELTPDFELIIYLLSSA
jgi:hypothetical protein